MSQPVVIQSVSTTSGAGSSSAAISFVSLPVSTNAVVLALGIRGPQTITSVTDNQGNTFTLDVSQATSSNSAQVAFWRLPLVGTTSGTYTVTATASAAVTGGWSLGLIEVSNLAGVIDQSVTLNDNGVNVSSFTISLPLNTYANDIILAASTLAGTYTTGNGFSGGMGGSVGIFFLNPNATAKQIAAAAYRITSFAEARSASWTYTLADGFAAVMVSLRGSPLADGFTASGSTVATGTGGGTMPAVNQGNLLDVLFMAQSGTAHPCTCADNIGNTYTQIDHNDSSAAHSREFYRFRSLVTFAGTPTITCSYGGTASLSVAAAVLAGINASNAFISGQVANHYQTAASIGASPAVDLQSSGNSPPLVVQPVTLAAWGYCDGKNAAPAAGSTFTAAVAGTKLWGALGAACLNYETKLYGSTAAVSGKFTPVPSQDAYTFLAVFDLVSVPITPSGPMPRQIYILP